jgi:hypothetical protein
MDPDPTITANMVQEAKSGLASMMNETDAPLTCSQLSDFLSQQSHTL